LIVKCVFGCDRIKNVYESCCIHIVLGSLDYKID